MRGREYSPRCALVLITIQFGFRSLLLDNSGTGIEVICLLTIPISPRPSYKKTRFPLNQPRYVQDQEPSVQFSNIKHFQYTRYPYSTIEPIVRPASLCTSPHSTTIQKDPLNNLVCRIVKPHTKTQTTMRYFSAILLALLGVFVNLSMAAECYSQSGASNCLTRDRLWGVIEDYCDGKWDDKCHNFKDYDEHDFREGFIGSIGKFPSKGACIEAARSIVNQCYGYRNGGSWTYVGASINISFCPWAH